MRNKNAGDLRSGDQIVSDGAWDRVHGVNRDDAPLGKVLVTTDSRRRAEYDTAASVRVV